MTPPPDSGGQINPFGRPPLVDAGRLDTDHIGSARVITPSSINAPWQATAIVVVRVAGTGLRTDPCSAGEECGRSRAG
jgi:hypothetical protein